MSARRIPTFLAGAAVALAIALPLSLAAGPDEPPAGDMAEMLKKAAQYTKPGPAHAALEKFLGEWKVESRLCHAGQKMPAEPGSAEFSWLYEGRWLKQEARGSVMGMPIQSFSIMGYDNFKKSYVTATVSTMDTALNTVAGDMDQHSTALISYGTIDEYLTGEHDKHVKSVWRFVSEDELVLEIHDLAIGEENTMVIEQTYTRK